MTKYVSLKESDTVDLTDKEVIKHTPENNQTPRVQDITSEEDLQTCFISSIDNSTKDQLLLQCLLKYPDIFKKLNETLPSPLTIPF